MDAATPSDSQTTGPVPKRLNCGSELQLRHLIHGENGALAPEQLPLSAPRGRPTAPLPLSPAPDPLPRESASAPLLSPTSSQTPSSPRTPLFSPLPPHSIMNLNPFPSQSSLLLARQFVSEAADVPTPIGAPPAAGAPSCPDP